MAYIKAVLDKRGVKNKGRPLSKTAIYFILKSEKYAGIYNFKGEVFYNMFPRIVSEETYNIVRNKIEENHYGK